jgi:hypothetical protein
LRADAICAILNSAILVERMRKIFPSALLLALTSLTSAANAGDLSITTTSPLPNGAVGAAYSASITASGGTQPYTWSNVFLGCPTPPCGLPPGLTATFNSTSVSISGVPTLAGSFFVIYLVADSSVPQQTTSRSFAITIGPSSTSLSIVTTSLPGGTADVSYSAEIDAAGGTPPYTWSLVPLPCAVVLMCEVPPIDGDVSVQLAVARAVHLAHAAGAKGSKDLIRTELVAG